MRYGRRKWKHARSTRARYHADNAWHNSGAGSRQHFGPRPRRRQGRHDAQVAIVDHTVGRVAAAGEVAATLSMAVVHPSRSAARHGCEIPLTDLDGDCQVANRQLRKRKITLV